MAEPETAPWFRFSRLARYTSMLLCMLALVVLSPLVSDRLVSSIFLELLFTTTVVLLVFTVPERSALRIGTGVFAVLALVAKWSDHLWTEPTALLLIGQGMFVVLFLGATAIITVGLFRSRRVTTDSIAGAVCAYLFIGLAWADIFSLIEFLAPGSFDLSVNQIHDARESAGAFGYFSFVTLTTLGYGDIVPLSSPARAMSVLEDLLGQLYIVVFVSRLVSIRIQQEGES